MYTDPEKIEQVRNREEEDDCRATNGENEEPAHAAREEGCPCHIPVTFPCSLWSLPKIPS